MSTEIDELMKRTMDAYAAVEAGTGIPSPCWTEEQRKQAKNFKCEPNRLGVYLSSAKRNPQCLPMLNGYSIDITKVKDKAKVLSEELGNIDLGIDDFPLSWDVDLSQFWDIKKEENEFLYKLGDFYDETERGNGNKITADNSASNSWSYTQGKIIQPSKSATPWIASESDADYNTEQFYQLKDSSEALSERFKCYRSVDWDLKGSIFRALTICDNRLLVAMSWQFFLKPSLKVDSFVDYFSKVPAGLDKADGAADRFRDLMNRPNTPAESEIKRKILIDANAERKDYIDGNRVCGYYADIVLLDGTVIPVIIADVKGVHYGEYGNPKEFCNDFAMEGYGHHRVNMENGYTSRSIIEVIPWEYQDINKVVTALNLNYNKIVKVRVYNIKRVYSVGGKDLYVNWSHCN